MRRTRNADHGVRIHGHRYERIARWRKPGAANQFGLSAERDRLQAELAKAQSEREANAKPWIKSQCTDDILQLSNEEILSNVGREPRLRDLIAQLESGT